jgi:hypothetical protein
MASSAFNVMSEQFVDIAHTRQQEAEYILHKPRREPYQSLDCASRVLWVHTKDRYVVWVVGGKFFLTVNEQELLGEPGLQNIDDPISKARVGEFINDYRLDRRKYTEADPKRRGKKQKTLHTASRDNAGSATDAGPKEADADATPMVIGAAATATTRDEEKFQQVEAHEQVEQVEAEPEHAEAQGAEDLVDASEEMELSASAPSAPETGGLLTMPTPAEPLVETSTVVTSTETVVQHADAAETADAETADAETADAETADAETVVEHADAAETADVETAETVVEHADAAETADAETANAETAHAETAVEHADAETADGETAKAEAADAEAADAEAAALSVETAEAAAYAIEETVILTAPTPADATAADASSSGASSSSKESQVEIDLRTQLDRQKQRADAAEAEAENERRKHRNYIKTKGKEVSKLKEEINKRPSPSEMERLKKENEKAESIISSEKYQELKASGTDATARFKDLIELVTASYQKRIDEAKEKGRAYEAAMDAREAAPIANAKESVYQFKDDYNQWTDITDSGLISAYASLGASCKTVQHSFNGTDYTLAFVSSSTSTTKAPTLRFKQLNTQTKKMREVRKIERDAAPPPPRESLLNGMLAEDRNNIMFGPDSPIELPDALVDSWLNTTNFYTPPTQQLSLALSKLADLFAQCSDSNFRYTVDAGQQPTNKRSTHVVPHTDGVKDFMSELWIKPAALSQWLSHAHWRGYKHARIVCHGTSKEGYAGMRSHGIGLSMDHSGKNGQAYGPGLYFGLSDHATVGYNSGSGYPPGSYIMGLMLTSDKEGWQHHHGGYRLSRMSKEEISSYKTISFGTPVIGMDNAAVLHDPALAVAIGVVRSFDDKHGHGWAYKY